MYEFVRSEQMALKDVRGDASKVFLLNKVLNIYDELSP